MKILLTGGVALVLGLAAGALYGGNRLKDETLATGVAAQADAGSAPSLPGALPDEAGRVGTVPEPGGTPAGGTNEDAAAPEPDVAAAAASAVASADPPPTAGSGGALDASATAAGTTTAATGGGPDTDAGADAEASTGAVQLARMFSVMRPEDAAAVLQELSDPEVGAILRHMQSRLSGQILAAFAPDRAAHLSRTVLRGTVGP